MPYDAAQFFGLIFLVVVAEVVATLSTNRWEGEVRAKGNFAVDLGRNVVKYESQLRLDLTLVFTLIQLTLHHTHTLIHSPTAYFITSPLVQPHALPKLTRNWPGQAIGFWLPVSPP